MTVLSKQDDSKSQVAGPARDRSPPQDGGSMVRLFSMIRKSHEIETGWDN
jgi:hypothetical protein